MTQKDCNSNLLLATNFLDTLDGLLHDCEKHKDMKACSSTSLVQRGYKRLIRRGLEPCVDKEAIEWIDDIVAKAVESAKEVI